LLLAFALVLVACGGDDAQSAACRNVRGGPEAPVSVWACDSSRAAAELRDRYGFASCRLVEGMDAESRLEADSAYQCRR
jgi:hypothetical protein